MGIHLDARVGEIAESILLPGDPLRAKFLAEKYFENPVCHNQIRGMLGLYRLC
jgi:purine-nucleoside phosphorylase